MDRRETRRREQRDSPKYKIKKLEREMERLREESSRIARALADTEADTGSGIDPLYAAQNKKRRLKLLLRQSETRNALEEVEEDWLEASVALEARWTKDHAGRMGMDGRSGGASRLASNISMLTLSNHSRVPVAPGVFYLVPTSA